MMTRGMMMSAATLVAAVVLAAPPEKADPVAANYIDWRGVTPKNYLCGREIVPSELRHKVTVLMEIEFTDKFDEQLEFIAKIVYQNPMSAGFGSEGVNWEAVEVPRNLLPVLSVCNLKNRGAFLEALSGKTNDKEVARQRLALKGWGCSTYQDVTFVGKPDSTGKLPYVYVMGPEPGKEPLYHGELKAANMKDVMAAIVKGRQQIAAWSAEGSGKQAWCWFYGNVPNPKYNTSLAKTLEKAKNPKVVKCPLDPVMKELLTAVKSPDEEKANEAQVLYDAIVQTREELKLLIRHEAATWPHRAIYDIGRLYRFWPTEPKKQFEKVYLQMKQFPQAEAYGKIYARAMALSDPSFIIKNKSEMKKIVAELEKYKKKIYADRESTVLAIQNAALLLDMKLDSTISLVQSKIAE